MADDGELRLNDALFQRLRRNDEIQFLLALCVCVSEDALMPAEWLEVSLQPLHKCAVALAGDRRDRDEFSQ